VGLTFLQPLGAGEWKRADPAPIEGLTHKNPKAAGVRFEDEIPSAKPSKGVPAAVQGTPEAPTPPASLPSQYASYENPQPGEVVHRDYSSTQQLESTQTRTTTSGLPAAAVAVPALAASAFAVGAGGKDREPAATKVAEKAPAVGAAPAVVAPGTPAMQAGRAVGVENTPVKAADNEQAGLDYSRSVFRIADHSFCLSFIQT